MQRRSFLKIIGGGIVAAAGGATAYGLTRTPSDALAPWGAAGGYSDARMRALSYAVLAPNPHNRQPWLVRLDGEDAATLFFDTSRQLPATDPLDRQLTIGLGCFLELLSMAAASEGIRADIDLFPEGEDVMALDERSVAKIRFVPDASLPMDPLWAHVMERRSTKEPFDTSRTVAPEDMARVLAGAKHGNRMGGTVAQQDLQYWRDLTQDALQIEFETEHTYLESVELFRIGKREVNANPDGLDFSGLQFDLLGQTGLFTREKALDRTSMAFKGGVDSIFANCQSAMGFVWMVSDGNTRRDQIAAGRDWIRVNIAATAAGIAFHPMSQALQEFEEMERLYLDVHERLAPNGGTVQMLSRIGYAAPVPVSPRWPIEAKLITT